VPRDGSHAARVALATCLICALTAVPGNAANMGGGGGAGLPGSIGPTGGAPIGGLVPKGTGKRIPPPPSKNAHGTWLRGVTVTQYWPAPESWFVGALITAPGLAGKHRIDWLYSAMGMSMQGDGIGLDRRTYHINALGQGGWVTATGVATSPSDGWSAGAPFWRAGGYWQGPGGAVTFPLVQGGWSAGLGRRYVPLPGVTFASITTSRSRSTRT
jgi:hypothetical protein